MVSWSTGSSPQSAAGTELGLHLFQWYLGSSGYLVYIVLLLCCILVLLGTTIGVTLYAVKIVDRYISKPFSKV